MRSDGHLHARLQDDIHCSSMHHVYVEATEQSMQPEVTFMHSDCTYVRTYVHDSHGLAKAQQAPITS